MVGEDDALLTSGGTAPGGARGRAVDRSSLDLGFERGRAALVAAAVAADDARALTLGGADGGRSLSVGRVRR